MSDSTVQPIQSTVSHSKYFKIDVLDIEVSAGPGVINREFVEVLRSVEYSFDDARHMFDGRKAENIRIINVRGDSMSGTIEPGDLLFVDITVKSFDGDGIYAFLYDDLSPCKAPANDGRISCWSSLITKLPHRGTRSRKTEMKPGVHLR